MRDRRIPHTICLEVETGVQQRCPIKPSSQRNLPGIHTVKIVKPPKHSEVPLLCQISNPRWKNGRVSPDHGNDQRIELEQVYREKWSY